MIERRRAAGAISAPPSFRRRSAPRPVGLAGLALLVTAMLFPGPARAFVPGALTPEQTERLTRAGMAGVPAARAFRLPEDPGAPVAPWRLLTVLVDFPDRTGDRNAHGPAWWHKALFGGLADRPSLAAYYLENSAGRFRIEGEVTSWVRMDSAAAYYLSAGVGNAGGGIDPGAYPHNAQRLVEEAVRKVAAGYDWSRFDNNGDGLVDGLLVVLAGQGVDETAPLDLPANRDRLLAHQFHTTGEVALPGARVFDYAAVGENATLGVVAHEVGHLLGLIDLYQTGSYTGGAGPFGLGDWSLMATGALLRGGTAPCHLDAWSKARLGFTRPARPTGSFPGSRLPAAEDSAAALRLWGRPDSGEYFLAETRLRRGFDRALPGEGLVVYHVFESLQTNSSSTRYKVALVQADGRNDLGTPGGNRGDIGDAYPSPTGNDGLEYGSTPSSLGYDSLPSGVTLTGIHRDGPEMRFDLVVERQPAPRIDRVVVHEVGGDGDGFVEGGESGSADLIIVNEGADILTPDLTVAFAPASDPFVTMTHSLVTVESLAAGERRTIPGAWRFDVGPGFPSEETAVVFNTVLAYSVCPACPAVLTADSLYIGLGGAPRPADDFEAGAPGWTHESLRPLSADPWHLSRVRAHSPEQAWFLGGDAGGLYAPALDAVLVSPPMRVPARGRLTFWQSVEAESLASNRAWDGGRVEIAATDGAWQPLNPVDGYPFRLESGSGNALFGARAFSGRRGWQRIACDLSGWAGVTVRVRFRFVSDYFGEAPEGASHTGWWLDDVAMESGAGPPALTIDTPEPGRVRLRWTEPAAEPAAASDAWRLYRRPDQSDAVEALVASRAAAPGGQFEVLDLPAAGTYRYRLAREAEGGALEATLSEPVRVGVAGARVELGPPFPNPYRPTGPVLNLELTLPDSVPAATGAIEIIDIAGRLVTTLPFSAAAGGRFRLQWDGQSARGPLRAGIYFVRLRLEGEGGTVSYPASHRLVVVS